MRRQCTRRHLRFSRDRGRSLVAPSCSRGEDGVAGGIEGPPPVANSDGLGAAELHVAGDHTSTGESSDVIPVAARTVCLRETADVGRDVNSSRLGRQAMARADASKAGLRLSPSLSSSLRPSPRHP